MSSPSVLGNSQPILSWIIGVTYDARATSLPDGEIVAEPTVRSTCMATPVSNVALSKADLIVFPFRDSSIILAICYEGSRHLRIVAAQGRRTLLMSCPSVAFRVGSRDHSTCCKLVAAVTMDYATIPRLSEAIFIPCKLESHEIVGQ